MFYLIPHKIYSLFFWNFLRKLYFDHIQATIIWNIFQNFELESQYSKILRFACKFQGYLKKFRYIIIFGPHILSNNFYFPNLQNLRFFRNSILHPLILVNGTFCLPISQFVYFFLLFFTLILFSIQQACSIKSVQQKISQYFPIYQLSSFFIWRIISIRQKHKIESFKINSAIQMPNTIWLYNNLKMVRKNQEQRKSKKQDNICSVCLERSANGEIDCHHKFCMKCISRWAKKKQTCPLCRKRIFSIKYGKTIRIIESKLKSTFRDPPTSSNVRLRISWKPLFIIGFPYINYFVPNPSLMQPVSL